VRVSAEQASKPLQVPVGQQIELFRAFLGDEVLLLARRAAAGAGAEGRDPGVWRGASRAGRRRRRRLLLLLQEQQQLLPLSALLLLLERGWLELSRCIVLAPRRRGRQRLLGEEASLSSMHFFLDASSSSFFSSSALSWISARLFFFSVSVSLLSL
jgi:hypothetical protein